MLLPAGFGASRALLQALSHGFCQQWGWHTQSRMLSRSRWTVTKSAGVGRRDPCTLTVPLCGMRRGLGLVGCSACQAAEADAFHLRVTGSCQGRAGNVRDCCRVTVQSGRWSMMDLSLRIQAVFKYSAESEVTAHGSRQNFCTSL